MKKSNYRHKVKRVLAQVRAKYNITGRLTDADFYRICEGEKIRLFKNDAVREKYRAIEVEGCYVKDRVTGRCFIYLRSFFTRKINLFVASHELGHHFLGHLAGNKRAGKGKVLEMKEKEANYFARLLTKAEVTK